MVENTNQQPAQVAAPQNQAPQSQAPQGARQMQFDFFTATLDGIGDKDIAIFSESNGLPVVFNSLDYYKQRFPNVDPDELGLMHAKVQEQFKDFNLGKYHQSVSRYEQLSTLPFNTSFHRMGFSTRGVDEEQNRVINLGQTTMFGLGLPSEGINILTPDEAARAMDYIIRQDNSLAPNNRLNRAGRNLVVVANEDPNSILRYVYKEVPFGEQAAVNDLRSIFGRKRVETPFIGNFFSPSSFASGSIGFAVNSVGSITSIVGNTFQAVFNPEDYRLGEDNLVTKIGNSISNHGASISRVHQDRQLRPFEEASSFSSAFYSGLGQLFSMVALSSRIAKGGPKAAANAPYWAIGLGSANAGSMVYRTALESGATPLQASAMFLSYGMATYVANMALSANIFATPISRKLTSLNTNVVKELGKQWHSPTGAALSTQTTEKVAEIAGKSFVKNIFRSRRELGDKMRSLSERSFLMRGGMGILEEGPEEILEDVINVPMDIFFNRHVFIPQARDIIREHELNQYEYFAETGADGLRNYYKRPKNGTKIPLSYNIWSQEQEDLQKARNVMQGNYPMDERVNLDEAVVAAMSAFVGGAGIHILSGASSVKKQNDLELLQERLAIDISGLSPKNQSLALEELRKTLQKEQLENNIFGPNNINEQGAVVNPDTGGRSTADIAIETFIQDIKLNLDLIATSGINSPSMLATMKNNKYLGIEAIREVKDIRAIETAIAQKEAKQPVVVQPGLFDENVTIEALNKLLETKRLAYKNIVIPRDGVGGKKTSLRYSQLYLENRFTEESIRMKAEERATRFLNSLHKDKVPAYVVNKQSDEFINLASKYANQIKSDPKEVMMINWAKDPLRFFSTYEWEPGTQPEIYSFLDDIYKNFIGGEMQAVATEINANIELANELAGNKRHLDAFRSRIRQLGQVDFLAARDNEMDSDQLQNANAHLQSIEKVLEDFIVLDNIIQYSDAFTEEPEVYQSLKEQLDEQLGAFTDESDRLENAMMYYNTLEQQGEAAVEDMDTPYDFKPSPDANRLVTEASNIAKRFNTNLTQQREDRAKLASGLTSNYRHTKPIGNIANESPEIQSDLRKRALDRFTSQVNTTKVKTPNTIPIESMLEYYEGLLKGDELITNQTQIVDNLGVWKRNLELFNDAVRLNVDFIQALSGDDAQHSMLDGPENAHLLFTEEEKQAVTGKTDDLLRRISSMLENDRLSIFSREYAQVKEMIRHIEVRNFHLGEVIEFFTNNKTIAKENVALKEAYERIGQLLGDNGSLQFRILLEEFSSDSTQQSKDRLEILRKLYLLDAAISYAEDTLGSRLDGFIAEKSKELASKGRGLQLNQDFVSKPPAIRASQKIEGVYDAHRFKHDISNADVSSAYYWSVLTWANNLNRIGIIKNGVSIPKRSDIAIAYRNVLKSRMPTKEQTVAGSLPVGATLNVATYEQEQSLFHVIGFLLNPDQLKLTDSPSIRLRTQNLEQISNSILLRGNAGSGKSTQMLLDLYQTLEMINGASTPVTIIVPNEHLYKTHTANFRAIGKTDYNIIYTHEAHNKINEINDIVIIEESSMFNNESFLKLGKLLADKRKIYIADEAQTPDITHISAALPVKLYTIERTYPWTEVFRSGNPDHFAIDDYNRALAMGSREGVAPKVVYSYDTEGKITGSRYYQNKELLRNSFFNEWGRTLPENRTRENLIYVVTSNAEMTDFMHLVEKKYAGNQEAINNIKSLVFTVLYDSKDHNRSVMGLTTYKSFVEFDKEAFGQKLAANEGLGSVSFEALSPTLLSHVGRVAYTGSSRRAAFIGMIGDPGASSEGRVHSVVSTISDRDKLSLRGVAINRLDIIYGKPKTATTPGTQVVEEIVEEVATVEVTTEDLEVKPAEAPITHAFDRSFMLTEESRKQIENSKELKNMREKLQVENAKRLVDFENEEKLIYHATDIAFESIKSKLTPIEGKDKDNNQVSRARAAVFSQIMRYHFDRNPKTYEKVLARIDDLNKTYRSIDPEHKSIIKDQRAFFLNTYKTIATDLNFNVLDPLNIVSPLLIKNDAVVVVDGAEQKAVLQASPALMKVVGIDKEGNPIVDILEFVFHDNVGSVSTTPGPYTKAKLAMYAAMAEQGSYYRDNKPRKIKINRVFVSNYLDKAGMLNYQGTYMVSDGDIIEYLKDIQKHFLDIDKSGMELGRVLADENDFFRNERIIDDPLVKPKILYYRGTGLTREKIRVTTVRKKVTDKGNVIMYVYFIDANRVEQKMEYNKFLKTYRSASAKEALSNNEIFNYRAIVHSKTGAVMSHALVFSPAELKAGGNFNDLFIGPIFRARMKFLGAIGNSAPIVKRYNGKMDLPKYNPKTELYSMRESNHVVTNEIPDEHLNDNQDLVRNTLVDAGFTDIDGKSFEEVLDIFKEHRFHIISMDNSPEAGFGFDNSLTQDPLAHNFISQFLINDRNTPEYTRAFDSLENLIRTRFPQDDVHYDALVEYNINKLIDLKILYQLSLSPDNTGADASILNIEPGNIKRGNVPISAELFVEQMKLRGFVASEPKLASNEFGRSYFVISFNREGIPDSVDVMFDAKPATAKYIKDLEDKLDEFSKDNEELQGIEMQLNELLAKDPSIRTDDDLSLISKIAHKGFGMLEEEPAFQFIAANTSLIKNIHDQIAFRIRTKNKGQQKGDLNFTGFLIDHDTKGVSITGRSISDKLTNLKAVLVELRDMVKNNIKVGGVDLNLRVDPYYLPDTAETYAISEKEILVDMLETTAELIKNPEVYTISDEIKALANKYFIPQQEVVEAVQEDETVVGEGDTIVEYTEEYNEERISSRDKYRDLSDDDDFSLGLEEAYNLDGSNSESINDSLAEIRRVIGNAGKKYEIELNEFDFTGRNGVVQYGQLSGNILRLWGKEIDGKTVVLKNVGRHESMHYIMKYLLRRSDYVNIMNEVAISIGVENSAENHVIIHEAIADSFMTMDTIKKPDTLWQRFIHALKEIANYIGFYSLTYNEMMVAADRGFYANINANPEANTRIDSFDKSAISKWGEYDQIQNAIKIVGNKQLYEIVKEKYLIPDFISYTPLGKGLSYITDDINMAIARLVKNNRNDNHNNEVSNTLHKIEGVDVKVSDFTPDQFAYLIRNKSRAAMGDFAAHLLSKKEVILPMLQEILPNSNISNMYRDGMNRMYNANHPKEAQSNASSEVAAHTTETRSYTDTITDLQELLFSTVRYRTYDPHSINSGMNASRVRYVSSAVVKKIFIDAVEALDVEGYDTQIDRQMIFDTLKDQLKSKRFDTYTRNAIFSVLLQFGEEFLTMAPDANTNYKRKYIIKKGVLESVGYLHIIKNLNTFDKLSKSGKAPFSARRQVYEDILSSIVKTFGGTVADRTATANFKNQTLAVKTNAATLIQRSNLEDIITQRLFDDDGFVTERFGNILKGTIDGSNFEVTDAGFKYKSPDAQSKRIAEYNMYEYLTKSTDLTAAEMAAVFKSFGVYHFKSSLFANLLSTGKNKHTTEFLNIIHRILVVSKVNHALSIAIKDVVADINLENSKGKKPHPDVDIFQSAVARLSEKDKVLFDHMLKRIYEGEYFSTKGVYSFKHYQFETLVTAEYQSGGEAINQTFNVPSPLDLYKDLTTLAEMIVDVSGITPPSFTRTPGGDIRHSLRKRSFLDRLRHGSKNLVDQIKKELSESTGVNPLITKKKIIKDRKETDSIIYNNPFLNNKIAFTGTNNVDGVTNDPKGKDFSDLVAHDYYVIMIETMLMSDLRKRHGLSRYNVLLTPFSEYGKGVAGTFYFPKPKGTDKFFLIDYKGSRIEGISINESLIVDSVNDIVRYYEARQNKTLNLIMDVMGEKTIEDVRTKAIEGTEILLTEEQYRNVRLNLQVDRDYVVVRENKINRVDEKGIERAPSYTVTIKYGRAAHMKDVVFDHVFREGWEETSLKLQTAPKEYMKTISELYDSLKVALSGDFKIFAKDLLDTKAYNYFLRDGSKVPKEFFSDFDSEYIKTLSGYGDQITAAKNAWILKDNVVQEKFKGVSTVSELYKLDAKVAKDAYSRMMKDPKLRGNIDGLRKLSEEYVELNHLNTIRAVAGEGIVQMKKRKGEDKVPDLDRQYEWPPMLEGIYMLHWLVNESLGTVLRDDITNYTNISGMIKRGSVIKAPGNPFDVSNSGGIGEYFNYAVMEDIPGYNTMYGVNPGDKAGKKLWTDGYVPVNPVTMIHAARSHGGDLGNINSNINKTVLFGRDHKIDQLFNFKMAMGNIIEEMYYNSTFYKNVFEVMLGNDQNREQFRAFLNETRSFSQAVLMMANWTVIPQTITDPVTGITETFLPRDKMIHFLVHESAFKSAATGINAYKYKETDPTLWSANNIIGPSDNLKVMKVPSRFLTLQNINNGTGDADLHSFATQLFSVVGVFSHNAPYYNAIRNALASKTTRISIEIGKVVDDFVNESNVNTPEAISAAQSKAKKAFYRIVRNVAGKSAKGSKFEELLAIDADPNTMYKKLNETFISYLNAHLKPPVPGHNAPQQPLVMNVYRGDNDKIAYLAQDLSLMGDDTDAIGYNRSTLRPLMFYKKGGEEAFTSKEELRKHLEGSLEDGGGVVIVPAEVIMRFQYLNEFGLDSRSSLASVMSVRGQKGNVNLYETGYQRAAGLGAKNGTASVENIIKLTGVTTVGELLNSFNDPSVKKRFHNYIRGKAIAALNEENALGKGETRLSKEEAAGIIEKRYNELLLKSLDASVAQDDGTTVADPIVNSFKEFVGSYFFNLNNALDVLTVRIPTSGPASASAGRIVAFMNTASNAIYTSPEKSILDGSDYDYDELHVFYYRLRGITANMGAFENVILSNMLKYYKDIRNYEILLTPIDLSQLLEKGRLSEANANVPKIAHSISSHVYNQSAIYVGKNLVGHFANQMRYTNNQMALEEDLKSKVIAADLYNMHSHNVMEGDVIVGQTNNFLHIIDAINSFVNAATDNPNLDGLLGRINVKASVTNFMLGMLASTPVQEGQSIQTLVLDELSKPVLREAVERVESMKKMTYLGAGTTLAEALDYVGDNNSKHKDETERLKKYAYIGEQINNLGKILGLIQEVPGLDAKYKRKLNDINYALGQELGEFLSDDNITAVKRLDIKNNIDFPADVEKQITYLKDTHFSKKEEDRFLEHERELRKYLNIKSIVAHDRYLLAQLKAIHSFNQVREVLFFGEKYPAVKNKVLEAVGKKRIMYDEEVNDLTHAIDKMLIGTYFAITDNKVNLNYETIRDGQQVTVNREFDLSKADQVIEFLRAMPEYVSHLKSNDPNNSFLSNIDSEAGIAVPMLILRVKDSIHLSPSEKAFRRDEFRRLAEETTQDGTKTITEAGRAFRYYQALMYGFSFRNGSFADVIDTGFEGQFTQEISKVEKRILENFDKNSELVATELAMIADSIIERNSPTETAKANVFKRTTGMGTMASYYLKSGYAGGLMGNNKDLHGNLLVNNKYPKQINVYVHGEMLTNDFVYDKLSSEQLNELSERNTVTKTTAGWIGVRKEDYGPPEETVFKKVEQAKKTRSDKKPPSHQNIPYDGAIARTVFNDKVKVKFNNDNSATFTKLGSDGKLLASRISFSNSVVAARALDALVGAVNKSFAGVNVSYVDNETAVNEESLGYFLNGNVYLNTDRVQTDTLFHELTHPLLHIIKHVHPGLYAVLTTEAQTMLDNGDPVALMIKERYTGLTKYDLLDEIVATVVGLNSVEAVQSFLAAQNDFSYMSNGLSFWQRTAGMIDRFWSAIKSFFKGYDLSIDPNTTSIKELSNQIVQKSLRGENVLNISSKKMKDILAAAYHTPVYQLKEPARNLNELNTLFTDVTTFNKKGVETPIPHYNNMDLLERVSHFKSNLPNLKYQYYINGRVYNFDVRTPGHIPESQWDKVITEEIMVEQDPKSMRLKKTILSWLNSEKPSIKTLIHALGVDDLGSYIYTEESINEFLAGINYTPSTKYYQYSNIWRHEHLAPYYSEELVGFDPIVAVEFDHEDQMLVSFYNVTTKMLRVPEITTPKDRKNILSGYMTDPKALRYGINNLTNTPGDVSNFLMGITGSRFVNAKNKRIHIGSIATVNIQPKVSLFETADAVILASNAEEMIKVDKFVNDLSPGMADAIKEFSLIRNGFSFERLLARKYMDEGSKVPGLDDFYQGAMNINDKRRWLNARLKDLEASGIASNIANQERRLIINALEVLEEGKIITNQVNSKKDFTVLENYIFPTIDANHPAIDLIRRTVGMTATRTVEQMKAFKEDINVFGQYFQDTYEKDNPAFNKFIFDVGPKQFERMIAHVIDDKGVKRNSGFILWTKDQSLDPLFYEQARELSDKDIEMGKIFVDKVTHVLTKNFLHRRVSDRGPVFYDIETKTQREYGYEDAKKDLFNQTTYRPGMIPLMPDTVAGIAGKGNIINALLKRKQQIESSYVMFDEMAQMSKQESQLIDSMPDQFMQQFLHNPSADMIGSLGLQGKRMKDLLGLIEIVSPDGKIEYAYDVSDANRTIGINTDLEILLEFLNMSTERKINYENDVLPLINGVRTYLLDVDTNQQFKQTNVLNFITMYTRQAIEGKRVKLNIAPAGINVDATVQIGMAFASPLVMAFNFNVGVVSATHSLMASFIEGVANNLTNSHWAGAGETAKASGLFFSDWHKVSQLAHQYNIISANDYEIVTHRYNQKRKKFLFSDFLVNWTNWAADNYARSVIMTAQMLKDGTYDAHVYNEKSGRTAYNPKMDKRFQIYFKGDESHAEYHKQKALYEGLKRRLLSDGIQLIDGEAAQAYSSRELRAIKTYADKYVVGAYGPLERNLLANYLIGRMFMMFTTWLMTKVSNAFKTGSYIDDLGYYEITKDEDGNLVPKWVREWQEGYLNTVYNMGRRLIFDGDTKQFSNMKNYERKNLIRFAMTLAVFLFFKLLYSMGVEDEERRGLEKLVPNIGFIPDWRIVRNISYATSSLLVFPILLEKAESPFAVIGILRRAFVQGLFGRDIKADNLRYFLPGYGGVDTLLEPFQDLIN